MNVVDLLRCDEGKTLEFKRDLSSPDNVLRACVAFANTSGGRILIGIEDKTRAVRGIDEPLQIEEKLANLISDNIVPHLVPEIEILSWRNMNLLGVEIHASSNMPHHLKKLGPKDGVYVRVGSTNRRADETLIDEMRRFVKNESYDEQILAGANSEEVDFRVASEIFEPVRKLRNKDLETLKVLTKYQGRLKPTVGGILLFGKNHENFFPDAWMQMGRFSGRDKTKIQDTQELHDHLPLMVEQVMAFIGKHSMRAAEIKGIHRKDKWNVPLVAVREAVVNALVHADYSQKGAPIRISYFDDRIEIENPGLLPFGLTVDEIQRGISKLRNRVIGRVFKEIGLIEQWGSGIQRITSACNDMGLPAPVFEEIGTHFRVTLRTVSVGPVKMDKIDQKIMGAFKSGEGLATSEIAGVIGLSVRATSTRLSKLVKRGCLTVVGTSSRDPQRKYYLSISD